MGIGNNRRIRGLKVEWWMGERLGWLLDLRDRDRSTRISQEGSQIGRRWRVGRGERRLSSGDRLRVGSWTLQCRQERLKTRSVQRTDEICHIWRVCECRQARLWHRYTRDRSDTKGRVREWCGLRATLHGVGLMEHQLGSNIRIHFRVVTEADIAWSCTPIEDLEGDLARELIGPR